MLSLNDFSPLSNTSYQNFQRQINFLKDQLTSVGGNVELVPNSLLMNITSNYDGSDYQFVGTLYTNINAALAYDQRALNADAQGFTIPFTYKQTSPNTAYNIYVQFIDPNTGNISQDIMLAMPFPGQTSVESPVVPPDPASITTPVTTPSETVTSGVTTQNPSTVPPASTSTAPIVQNYATMVSQMYEISPPLSDWSFQYDIGSIPTQQRTYSITNKTKNTSLFVSIVVPIYFNIDNQLFNLDASQTTTFTVAFSPNTTLISNQATSIGISITPNIHDPVVLS